MALYERQRQCANRGMTLLELTAAMFVITAGLFGILQVYLSALDHVRAMGEHGWAFEWVQQEMEAWRAADFDELVVGEHPFRTEAPASERLCEAVGRVEISEVEDGPPDLVEVRVVLAWRGEHGRAIEKDLATMIARKP